MLASRMSWPTWLVVCGLPVAACSPGPGRAPFVPDEGSRDGGSLSDSGHRVSDAGDRLDAGSADVPIGTRDAGGQTSFPFQGVYYIRDSTTELMAREVDGRLLVVVGGPTNTFHGSIDEDGNVDLRAPALESSGCDRPSVTGWYERASALYELSYRSCGSDLSVVESTLKGGFKSDFDGFRSGIFDVTMEIAFDSTGCFLGDPQNLTGRWGISFGANRVVSLFTAHDIVTIPNVYIGQANATYAFSAIHRANAFGGGVSAAINAGFEQITLNDPLRISGQRTVFDATRNCTFQVLYEGVRTSAP